MTIRLKNTIYNHCKNYLDPIEIEKRRMAKCKLLEQQAYRHPVNFHIKMFSILMFGYLFLFTMLLCPVILIITFTEHGLRASSWWLLYLSWNAILILVIFLQTIFQKDPEKTDYILELEEAPILFAIVKEVSLKLQLPMPDRITLNMEAIAKVLVRRN